MVRRRLLSKALLLFSFLSWALVAGASELKPAAKASPKGPQYPAITEWQGQVWLTGKDGRRELLKSKQVLRDSAFLETSAEGQVVVQLDPQRRVLVLSASEVSFPTIHGDLAEARQLVLKRGEIHWQQELKAASAFACQVSSDLFDFVAPAGNYVLAVYPEKAYTQVKVFEGSMEFAPLNGEQSARVAMGQQVAFQGVLEDGEIAYDILLKGKKVPRGHLAPVIPIDIKEVKRVEEAKKKLAAEAVRRQRVAAEAKARLKKSGAICQEPPGKLNECVWRCVNNPKSERKACLVGKKAGVACVRQRCNANGVWAQSVDLSAEKGGTICKAQPVVAPCDY